MMSCHTNPIDPDGYRGTETELPLRVLLLVAHAAGKGERRGVNGSEVEILTSLDLWDRSRVEPIVAYSHEGQLSHVARGSDRWKDFAFSEKRFLCEFLLLCRILRQCSVRVVHSYGPVSVDFLTVLAAQVTGMRSVVTRPVMIADLKGGRVLKWGSRLLDRFTLRAVDRVVAICEHGRKTLVADGCPASKLVSIYNGVDIERFSPEVAPRRDIQQWRGDSFTIGMFAQMTKVKRHDLLIRALAKAIENGRDWRLVLAGDGPLLRKLEGLAARLKLGTRVLFLGFVKDTPPTYAACDVVALASDREGFPITLMESLACGKPVVASNVAGSAELVGGAGILLEQNTTDDLYSALLEMEDPELRRRLGRIGREQIAAKYSIEDKIKKLEELYLSFLTGLEDVPGGAAGP